MRRAEGDLLALLLLAGCSGSADCADEPCKDTAETDADADSDADTDADTDTDTDTDTDSDTGPTWADIPLDTGAPGFGLIINELLADVGGGILNDANCDGAFGGDDQFLEIVNIGTLEIDLAGSTIERQGLLYWQFPRDSVLQPGQSVLVFSGGSPDFDGDAPGTEPWCQALGTDVSWTLASRPLDLPECGPFRVELVGPIGFVLDAVEAEQELCTGQSLVRSPELVRGSPFVPHGAVSPMSASPGTRADGSPL